jgi:hypothetical protein
VRARIEVPLTASTSTVGGMDTMGRAESDNNRIWMAAPTRVAGILMTGDESNPNKSVQNQRAKGNR